MAGGGTELLRSAASGVEASQNLRVEFVGDDAANLGISPGYEDSDWITYEDDGETGLRIGMAGINNGARTEFEGLLVFRNDGSNTITDIDISFDDSSSGAEVEIQADVSLPLESGESARGLGLTIDTTGGDQEPDISGTISISVDTDA